MILLIDNYDSFVYNLARYFERLGQPTTVVRNDSVTPQEIRARRPDAVVLSPGPCAPDQAGCSLAVVRELHRELPLLGVCLGHQTIAQALGGRIVRASEPMHGMASDVHHAQGRLFAGLPNPFVAARYHSLQVEEASLPAELRITARTADGVPMALEHVALPVFGVQFHPESILTEMGYEILASFLKLAGLTASSAPSFSAECPCRATATRPLPLGPLTF